MRKAEPATPRTRDPRYRRRLRSRIIVSFVLLGLGLTVLFAFLTQYARNRVENALVEDVMNQNIELAAMQYDLNPDNPAAHPVGRMRAFVYTRGQFEQVRIREPEWYALGDGIYSFSGEEDGTAFAYKLAVRKTPEVWFFLAHDMTQTLRGEYEFRRALYGAVVLFSLLSLLIGSWAASRVMHPVSALVAQLGRSGNQPQYEPLAPHFADDEVGELAKALDDYSNRLTEVVRRDREFNADVSHELRTPLAVIKGAVELLLSRPGLDEKTHTRLLRIQRAEHQCADLIGALLLLSRNERAQGQCDVARAAEQLLEMHRQQLGDKSLELRLERGPELIVDAPEAVVMVALGNLIGNAVKYTREGGVVVRVHEGAVEVIDSGPGLSQQDAARLFERGYRGTHAGHSHGGGIGLSIVRRLCQLYGWEVKMRPGEERGAIASLVFVSGSDPDEALMGKRQV